MENQWSIPDRLAEEEKWVQYLVGVVVTFWVLGFIDLSLYYWSMNYPQESYFLTSSQQELENSLLNQKEDSTKREDQRFNIK